MDHKWEEKLRTLDSDQLEIQKEMTRLIKELNNYSQIKNADPDEKDSALSEINRIEERYILIDDILHDNFVLKITIIESLIGLVKAELKVAEYSKNYVNMFKEAL